MNQIIRPIYYYVYKNINKVSRKNLLIYNSEVVERINTLILPD